MEEIKSFKFQPHDPRLSKLLKDISVEEDKHGRGMLTVIVVRKNENQRPGKGFYDLAVTLGRNTQDTEACFAAEMNHVHTYWKNDAS